MTSTTAACRGSIVPGSWGMDYDRDKVDEMVLALLWLTPAGDGRVWKGHDWDALDLFLAKTQSGATSDPSNDAGDRIIRRLRRVRVGRECDSW